MKTKVIKRVIAFALATLIILGTLGYFFSMVAWAATTTTGITNITYKLSAKPLKEGNKATVTVKFEADNSLHAKLNATDNQVSLSGSFDTSENDAKGKCTLSGKDGNYTVVQENAKYTGTGKEIAIQIKDKSGTDIATISKEMSSSDVTENTSNPGGDVDNPDPPSQPDPVQNTMDCTLWQAWDSRGNLIYDFNSDSQNDTLRAPTLTSGCTATFRIRISNPNAAAADVGDGINSYVNAVVSGGSFVPTEDSKYIVKNPTDPNGEGNGVVYELELTKLKYTGKGNILNLTIKSKEAYAEKGYYSTHQATIDACVPYTPPVDNDDDGKPDYSDMQMATPYVIVSNYSYGGTVTAGQTFPLSITLYNTSRNIDVTNMMVTITMPEALMLTSSSNTFYIDHLDTESSVSQTVQVTAKVNAAPQSHNIDISMKYQYIDDHLVSRRDNSTQETISIPVVQIDRFQVTGVDAPAEAYLGEENYLTVNFVNKGRSDVYNLSAEISGDIQNPGQQQNLGNLTSGSTGSAEFTILPNGEGVCNGEIKIIYEDTNMEEKTATILWSTTVVDPSAGMEFPGGMGDFDPGMTDDPSLMDEGEKKPSWPFIAGGVAVAALVVGLLVRRHILKKRSEEEDANL